MDVLFPLVVLRKESVFIGLFLAVLPKDSVFKGFSVLFIFLAFKNVTSDSALLGSSSDSSLNKVSKFSDSEFAFSVYFQYKFK